MRSKLHSNQSPQKLYPNLALIRKEGAHASKSPKSAKQLSLDSKKVDEKSSNSKDSVGNTYFGIRGKPGVTMWNILAIFVIQFFVILINNDYISQTQGLLMNEKYFNLSKTEATELQSEN